MDTSFIFLNCYTGTNCENLVMDILNENGFAAKKTGSNDGGIDIVAESITKPKTYTFNIQCKFFNRPLSKAPIQEVFSGTHYYGNGGRPVVITNNRVTAEARVYAKRLGVEIIGDAEWVEIKQVRAAQKIINPNVHIGLLGILLANIVRDRDYLIQVAEELDNTKLEAPSDKEQLKIDLINDFDEAEEYMKEAAYLQQKAANCSQKALSLQKKALLRNLEFG